MNILCIALSWVLILLYLEFRSYNRGKVKLIEIHIEHSVVLLGSKYLSPPSSTIKRLFNKLMKTMIEMCCSVRSVTAGEKVIIRIGKCNYCCDLNKLSFISEELFTRVELYSANTL